MGSRRLPRRISARYLENAALFHLGKYACSVQGLRRVLLRKVERSLKVHGGEKDIAVGWVEALLLRFERSGYLDDQRFAHSKAGSLQRRGSSTRHIQMQLRVKGVAPQLAAESVEALLEEGVPPDWVAAVAYARRRRLGPFRKTALGGRAARQKEFAAFARKGFPFSLAKKIVDASDAEALVF